MREKKSRLFSRVWEMPYGRTNPFHLFDASKNSKEFVQKLHLQIKIPVHNGCVNSICWNDNGKYLLSGSDDQRLSIVHGYDYSVLAYIHTGHRANIFSAKFLPNTGDSNVVSCSGDGIIIYSNLDRPETSINNKYNCHKGTAYEIMTVPNDSNTFLSCGEDRTVRWFDVRTKTSCTKEDCKDDILINCRSPVTSLAVNPLTPYQLAVGCADASVRIFDRRMLSTQAAGSCSNNGFQALMTCFTVPEFTQSRRITSLCYSADGQEMLVSYSSDYIYLFDIRDDLDKKPRLLSRDSSSNGSDNESGLFYRGKPLMKRLRVRGDWSDTGPNARPEAEGRVEQQEATPQANIVRRMTDILTRMFNSSAQTQSRSAASHSSSASSHASSQSEDGEGDAASDSNEENAGETTSEGRAAKSVKRKVEKPEGEAGPSKEPPKPEVEEKSDIRTKSDLPSTSCSAFEHIKMKTNSSESKPSTSGAELGSETDNVITSVCDESITKDSDAKRMLSESVDLSFKNIEQKLDARRNDLIEQHHSEPMVNLHYSGQSVSSGLITMDIASSSTANERQWLEQSASDLPELPSCVCPQEQPSPVSQSIITEEINDPVADRVSSGSETEAAVQTIQPAQSFLPVITNIRSLGNPSASSEVPEASAEGEENEVELMMEVDSWDIDSDDEVRPSLHTGGATRRCPANFLSSINDEVKARNEELKKEESHLASITQPRVKQKYTGHRNARTMIKESTFWGDNFIMSGSDCGHIFIWDRQTAELIMLMEADHHVVNCLQPHPFDPILASSGIDYDIKLWAPLKEEPFFDMEKAAEIIKRNEIMLEETKDTITVPASFMFRMLATLNHFRTGRAYRWGRAAREMRAANSDSSTR